MKHALAILTAQLDLYRTNEPISRAEGRIIQADLSLEVIAELEESLRILQDPSQLEEGVTKKVVMTITSGEDDEKSVTVSMDLYPEASDDDENPALGMAGRILRMFSDLH